MGNLKSIKIDKKNWKLYFDRLSKISQGQKVELEIEGPDIGNQIERDWTMLDGFSYDPDEDVFRVYMEPLDHAIAHPIEITIAEDGPILDSLMIKDSAGYEQILHFRHPNQISGEGPPEY